MDQRLEPARVWYDLWKNCHEIVTIYPPPPHPYNPSNLVTVSKDHQCQVPSKEHEKGLKIKRVDLNLSSRRIFIYTLPETLTSTTEEYDLIIFYHGARGNAYEQVVLTNLSSYLTQNIITVYGQCSGEMMEPYIHPDYNHVAYGEIYWEIRDSDPLFQDEIEYTQSII